MAAIFDFYVTTTEGDDKAKSVLIENDGELVEIHLNDKEKIFLDVDDVAYLIHIFSEIYEEMDKEL